MSFTRNLIKPNICVYRVFLKYKHLICSFVNINSILCVNMLSMRSRCEYAFLCSCNICVMLSIFMFNTSFV